MSKAAAMPTEYGVKVARNQCAAQFDAQRKAAEAVTVERFLESWKQVGAAINTADGARQALGDPLLVAGPDPCWSEAGSPAKQPKCLRMAWTDPRPGRLCSGVVTVAGSCTFQLEVFAATEGVKAGGLHVWWPESF